MNPPLNSIALLYDDDAYVETTRKPEGQAPPRARPMGLMGRQVAGKEFLDACLSHGRFTEFVGLVRNQRSAESLTQLWKTHPGTQASARCLRIVGEQNFHNTFFPSPPATMLHVPGPANPRYAWARQHAGPAAFALSGITHTICTSGVVQLLCSLVTAPFEEFDTVVCSSRAGLQAVRTITGMYADYLRERHAGNPGIRIRLERIPLGVNAEKFRPPTGDKRAACRRALNVADDEVVVLSVGRMSFHAKGHPFPMYEGVAAAAQRTGKKVHLIVSGWAANEHIADAFRTGAQAFAPGIRVSFVDSLNPKLRFSIWHAADIFTSLSDNIQETFGLVLPESMACGLPIVASDWDGYRDIVINGETGFLIPTYMIKDATADATSRLLLEEVNYDNFLAECNQTVAVDIAAATEAYARLIGDAELRRKMGMAGRRRVLDTYAWPHVIKAYENLWREQDIVRQEHHARLNDASQKRAPVAYRGPALYPAPEYSFASFATRILDEDATLAAVPESGAKIEQLLPHTLTNYSENRRCTDARLIRTVLEAAKSPFRVSELAQVLRAGGVADVPALATLAWMLKYGLLRVHNDAE